MTRLALVIENKVVLLILLNLHFKDVIKVDDMQTGRRASFSNLTVAIPSVGYDSTLHFLSYVTVTAESIHIDSGRTIGTGGN